MIDRHITPSFFRMTRDHIHLRKEEPVFMESSDFLIPDTLGAEKINIEQWQRWLSHFDDKQGVFPKTQKELGIRKPPPIDESKLPPGLDSADLGRFKVGDLAVEKAGEHILNQMAEPVLLSHQEAAVLGQLVGEVRPWKNKAALAAEARAAAAAARSGVGKAPVPGALPGQVGARAASGRRQYAGSRADVAGTWVAARLADGWHCMSLDV